MDNSSFNFFLSDIWPAVLEECKKNVATEAAYRLWISSLTPQSFENGKVCLTTHEFKRSIIIGKFLPVIKSAFMSVLGFDIDIEILALRSEDENEEADTSPKSFESTFDTFIVGSSNRLAYAAANAVAKNPGGVHNPLFIYGRSGLGKTHLLTAIEKEILKRKPKTRILYTNGESFTNDLVAHVLEKKMSDFHKNYRNADVLLFDDVQFIAGKIQTQEEFFHTFNALINTGKQIVLTSDRPPKDIERLEERLTSRFEQGLLVDIQPP
ncbi:MAG TPA: DnaA/Hda family protein, partial [Clostridiales bacterium]|nr:DnaA/Hda family protein [Clostridiales bacterium]